MTGTDDTPRRPTPSARTATASPTTSRSPTDTAPGPAGRQRLQREVRPRPGLLLLQPALLHRHRHASPSTAPTSRSPASAWLDREWSRQPLAAGQQGWDWFALTSTSGADADDLPHAPATTARPTSPAPGSTPTAPRRRSRPDQITATPGATAEVAGRTPAGRPGTSPSPTSASRWTPRALNAQSWIGTAFAYWEGPIRVTGSTHRPPATWR